jgi:hypothetical protein
MADIQTRLALQLTPYADDLARMIRLEEEIQGHRNTGALDRSIQADVLVSRGILQITVRALSYIRDLEDFTPGSDIKMSNAQFSRLTTWVSNHALRGVRKLIKKESATIVAYRILQTWRRTGRPTPASLVVQASVQVQLRMRLLNGELRMQNQLVMHL